MNSRYIYIDALSKVKDFILCNFTEDKLTKEEGLKAIPTHYIYWFSAFIVIVKITTISSWKCF